MTRSLSSFLMVVCLGLLVAVSGCAPASEISLPTETPQPQVDPVLVSTATPTTALQLPSATPTATAAPQMNYPPVYEMGALKYFTTDEHMVILTIDDGYSDQTVNQILDLLEEANVHATFFLVGNAVKDSLQYETLKRMIDNGNDIGYHSNTHPKIGIVQMMEKTEWQQDYDAWTETLKDKLGAKLYAKGVSPYARVPWGEWTGTFLAFCEENELIPVWWNIGNKSFEKGRVPPTAGGIFILHTIPDDLPVFDLLFASDWKVYSLREVFPVSE